MSEKFEIKSVKIRNFRSIKNEYIEVKKMNIFVGLNDVGKSNILKALNLFFNNQTDYNTPFDFDTDFSHYFSRKSHEAKEIVIELQFNIPDTYSGNGPYTWKKSWRQDDFLREEIKDKDGNTPSSRSKVSSSLKRIKYRYVPAIKSPEYYKSLLEDLYFTVSAVINSPLQKPINEFSNELQNYTLQISKEVENRIGISSKLSIPENLSALFSTLIFRTKDAVDNEVPLNMRGDGIQARHIPIILKYIADEDQKTRKQRSMKVTTFWGFEEPENGVELSRAFNMADDFLDYSKDIQMFLTTHSPAFYLKKEDENSKVFFISSGQEKREGTIIKEATEEMAVGNQMGLMPLIAPFIKEKEELIVSFEKNYLTDVPTIMVEGTSDRDYLLKVIEIYSPKLNEKIKNKTLKIFTKEGDGGCSRLVDWAYVWIYGINKSKAVVLFDKDAAGVSAYDKLINSEVYKKKRSSAAIQVKYLYPSDEIKYVVSKGIIPNYEIEHLFSLDFCKELREKGWFIERDYSIINEMLKNKLSRDKTVDEVLDKIIDRKEIIENYILVEPHPKKKDQILKYVLKMETDKQKQVLLPMKKTVEMLEKIF